MHTRAHTRARGGRHSSARRRATKIRAAFAPCRVWSPVLARLPYHRARADLFARGSMQGQRDNDDEYYYLASTYV